MRGVLRGWGRPGIEVPSAGQERLEITGHYDDPAPPTCRATIGDKPVVPALSILLFLVHFVVDAVGS